MELPPELPSMHNVFHATQLQKCFQLPNQPDLYKDIDHQSTDFQPDLTYCKKPISNLDQAECYTRSHTIKYFKVQWSTTRKQKQYEDVKTAPDLSFCIPFLAQFGNLGDEILVRGVGLSHPNFHGTSLKMINHDKMWFDKNFLTFYLSWFSLCVFKCS